MTMLIKIDGVSHTDRATAKISIFDHGFLFGDSIYEVVRTYRGKPYGVGPHLARLWKSARGIGLEMPCSKEEMAAQIASAVREAGLSGDAYVRIIVTRGVGEIDINPATCERPTTIIIVKDITIWPKESYERGVDIAIVREASRADAHGVDPTIKSGNYLSSVLALMMAKKRGAKDGCMVNARGELTECTNSNVFFVRRGAVFTPAIETGILEGITRTDVIRLARENRISLTEGRYKPEELFAADEAFLTSTTRGVMPIATVDGKAIGKGEKPVTARLSKLLAEDMERWFASA